MAVTFAQAVTMVDNVIGNDGNVSASLIKESINAGMKAILPWAYKFVEIEIEPTTAFSEYAIPSDYYAMVGIHDQKSGVYMPSFVFSPGNSPGDDMLTNNHWWLAHDNIAFANPIDTDTVLKIQYAGYWPELVNDSDVLGCPLWAVTGVILYAASYSLLQFATRSANIRQYNVSVDSGTPIHNPMREMSDYFLRRFEQEMERHPSFHGVTNG